MNWLCPMLVMIAAAVMTVRMKHTKAAIMFNVLYLLYNFRVWLTSPPSTSSDQRLHDSNTA
jgi:hypothetical protein